MNRVVGVAWGGTHRKMSKVSGIHPQFLTMKTSRLLIVIIDPPMKEWHLSASKFPKLSKFSKILKVIIDPPTKQ